MLRSTGSPLAATAHPQDSAKNRHPSTFSDLDVLKISTPACNAAERSITRSLMLENFPETSTIKREVQPNKLPTGQPSRRTLMAPKMPIKISLRRHFTILLPKSRNFFPFWVCCNENSPGIMKRSLNSLEGSLLLKAAVYVKREIFQFTEGQGCAVQYKSHSLTTRVTKHLKTRPVHTKKCWRQTLDLEDLVQGKGK